MRAVLVLFLKNVLLFTDNSATAIYHAFAMLCYFTPLFGAPLADGFLGKFWTIFYLSIVYIIGLILLAVTSIPPVNNGNAVGPLLGLLLIGIGTGGIKPCVSSFGGDQFSKGQEQELKSFFSVFYMSINLGSLASTYLTPYFRSEVECFDEDCYPLAFGVPAGLLIIALVMFVIGKPFYKIQQPVGENVVVSFVKCVFYALRRRIQNCCSSVHEHWLDYAEEKYDSKLVADVKSVLRVLVMFLPLPVFWALFDQQGSRWVLQAEKMNGELGGTFSIKPDQMQLLNPLLIVTLIPLFEGVLWPCFRCLHIPARPLQRMAAGMLFASGAFVIAAFVQLEVEKGVLIVPDNQVRYQIMNALPCDVNVTLPDGLSVLNSGNVMVYERNPNNAFNMTIDCDDTNVCSSYCKETSYTVEGSSGGVGYSLIAAEYDMATKGLQVLQYKDNLAKTSNGDMSFRAVSLLYTKQDIVFWSANTYKNKWFRDMTYGNISELAVNYDTGPYDVSIHAPDAENDEGFQFVKNINTDPGATYTYVLRSDIGNSDPAEVKVLEFVVVPANNMSILWQIPQFVVMTTGEVIFSVTGLEFAYSQAPPSMKALMQAGWLLTVAVGNLIVMIVAEVAFMPDQFSEFLLFAGLMLGVDIIFAIMAVFYTYVDYESHDPDAVEEDDPPPYSKGDPSYNNDADGHPIPLRSQTTWTDFGQRGEDNDNKTTIDRENGGVSTKM
ncbi:PREDICTED: solute carrier family 15 member 1-like isoform X2 [Priapulus caudatus]|nr:PREDICTED: solute carrier family 15 member 1-like isoform X2 [Priapulus caudatus]